MSSSNEATATFEFIVELHKFYKWICSYGGKFWDSMLWFILWLWPHEGWFWTIEIWDYRVDSDFDFQSYKFRSNWKANTKLQSRIGGVGNKAKSSEFPICSHY